MAATPLDSALHGTLYGDPEIGPLFSSEAEIAALIRVERALARAEAAAGVVPRDAAETLDRALAEITLAPELLAHDAAAAGTVIPALLAALSPHLPPDAAHWLHWGATSQDIEDTALVLRLGEALDILEARLDALTERLADDARRWRSLPMAGRTRAQVAAPISLGLRLARWRAPFAEALAELGPLRARVLRVQSGGAAGAGDVLGDRAEAVATRMAADLGLAPAPSWHTDRTGLAALAGWAARVAAASARVATDLILMGRSEIAEARAGTGGGSSTMPQKANPVQAETVLALARLVAGLTAPMHLAAMPAEERDGAAWALERLVLPQIVVATGAALRHTLALAETLEPDAAAMRATLAAGGGAAMAERASFLLAATMPKAEAKGLVKRALAETDGSTDLAAALSRLAPGTDWAAALDPSRVDAAAAATDAALAFRPKGDY